MLSFQPKHRHLVRYATVIPQQESEAITDDFHINVVRIACAVGTPVGAKYERESIGKWALVVVRL